jgi:hypothetical protein
MKAPLLILVLVLELNLDLDLDSAVAIVGGAAVGGDARYRQALSTRQERHTRLIENVDAKHARRAPSLPTEPALEDCVQLLS